MENETLRKIIVFFNRLGYKMVEFRDFGETVPAAAGSAVGVEFRIVPKEPKKD